jgi:hypothetical protein
VPEEVAKQIGLWLDPPWGNKGPRLTANLPKKYYPGTNSIKALIATKRKIEEALKLNGKVEAAVQKARAAKDRNAVAFGKFAWRRRNLKTLADQQKWAEKNLCRKREEMAEREKQMADTAPTVPARPCPSYQTANLKTARARSALRRGYPRDIEVVWFFVLSV